MSKSHDSLFPVSERKQVCRADSSAVGVAGLKRDADRGTRCLEFWSKGGSTEPARCSSLGSHWFVRDCGACNLQKDYKGWDSMQRLSWSETHAAF